jgi:hypothetical protein
MLVAIMQAMTIWQVRSVMVVGPLAQPVGGEERKP